MVGFSCSIIIILYHGNSKEKGCLIIHILSRRYNLLFGGTLASYVTDVLRGSSAAWLTGVMPTHATPM